MVITNTHRVPGTIRKIIFVFALCIMAACSSPAPQPAVESAAPTPTASSTPTNDPYPPSQALDYTKWPTQEPYPPPSPVASGYKPSPTRRPRPTSRPRPTPRPLPTATPLPSYDWTVPALKLYGEPSWFRPVQSQADPFTSPSGAYRLQCSHGAFNIYEMPEERLLASAVHPPATELECSGVTWRSDEKALLFSSTRGTYVWRYQAALPQPIGSLLPPKTRYVSASWEPHGKRLAVLLNEPSKRNQTEPFSLFIWDFQQRQGLKLGIDVPVEGDASIDWAFPNFVIISGYLRTNYMDVRTGDVIWVEVYTPMSAGYFPFQQELFMSPDQRWLALNEVIWDYTSPAKDRYHLRQYNLYDAQTRTYQLLAMGWGFHITYSGWTPDNTHLYWVSTPIADHKLYGFPGEKFGLTVYDPLTRQATVVLENVIQAEWNAGMTHAWVLIRRALPSGVEQTVSGIWAPGDTQVSSERILQEVVPEPPLPNLETYHTYNPPEFSVSWSYDGQKVVFATYGGQLILQDIHGTEQVLTDHLHSSSFGLWHVNLAWSPDDTHIFVRDMGSNTLLTIPSDLSAAQ